MLAGDIDTAMKPPKTFRYIYIYIYIYLALSICCSAVQVFDIKIYRQMLSRIQFIIIYVILCYVVSVGYGIVMYVCYSKNCETKYK